MSQYQLYFVNNSTISGSACVYQQDPNIGMPNVMSLAWFAKAANPNTSLLFQWNIDYNFVWSETGVLTPGVIFMAAEKVGANLKDQNLIEFTKENDAFTFKKPPKKGTTSGTLFIDQDDTIPSKMASVGVGMSGKGTFVVESQPSVLAKFTPHPQYWITFGTYQLGQVMDVETIVDKSAQIEFPPAVSTMTATLNKDNTWTVTPGAPKVLAATSYVLVSV